MVIIWPSVKALEPSLNNAAATFVPSEGPWRWPSHHCQALVPDLQTRSLKCSRICRLPMPLFGKLSYTQHGLMHGGGVAVVKNSWSSAIPLHASPRTALNLFDATTCACPGGGRGGGAFQGKDTILAGKLWHAGLHVG